MHLAYWLLLGFGILALFGALFLLALTVENKPASTLTPTPTVTVPLDFIFENKVSTSLLAKFATYITTNTLTGKSLDIPTLGAQLLFIRDLVVPSSNPRFGLAATYGNALVVLYCVSIGDVKTASSITNSFLVEMLIEGYFQDAPTSAQRIQVYQGIYTYYDPTTGRHSFGPDFQLTRDSISNAFNNAWMGIAFGKLILLVGKTLAKEDLEVYVRVVIDQISYLEAKHSTTTPHVGYFHSVDDKRLLTEDHIVIFALTVIYGEIKSKFSSDVQELDTQSSVAITMGVRCVNIIQALQNDKYVKNPCYPTPPPTPTPGSDAADDNNGYLFLGYSSPETTPVPKVENILCPSTSQDPSLNNTITTNSQSWGFLSHAILDDTQVFLNILWLRAEALKPDTDQHPLGCNTPLSSVKCTSRQITQKDLYQGMTRSFKGFGIDWESSAAALMSIYEFFLFSATADEKEIVKGQLSILFASLNKLATKYLPLGGIPGTLLDQTAAEAAVPGFGSTGEAQSSVTLSGLNNTGEGYNIFKHPNTTATIWTALSLEYLNSTAGLHFVPLLPNVGDVAVTSPFQSPTFLKNYTVETRLLCKLPTSTFPTGAACGLRGTIEETISLYCQRFETDEASTFIEPGTDIAPFGVTTTAQYPILCQSPLFNICDPQTQAASAQFFYKKYSKTKAC